MKIINFEEQYLDASKKLLKLSYRQETSERFLGEGRTVLGFIDDKLIGLAGLKINPLHDSIVVEYICVDPEHRREGYATKLHLKLLERFPLNPLERTLDISCYGGEVAEESFILSLGFIKTLDCHLCTFSISDVDLKKSKQNIISLEKFYLTNSKSEVRSFYINRYSKEHIEFMPVTNDETVWDDYYSDGDISGFGAVLLEDNQLRGCSFMHENIFEDKTIVCINGYASGDTIEKEAQNLIELYSYQITKLKSAGYQKIYIEIDSTEKVSDYLLGWVPLESKQVYMRYQQGF